MSITWARKATTYRIYIQSDGIKTHQKEVHGEEDL